MKWERRKLMQAVSNLRRERWPWGTAGTAWWDMCKDVGWRDHPDRKSLCLYTAADITESAAYAFTNGPR